MQKEQSIRTLSQAVEQAPVSIIITDTDGKIEYVNHSFELTTGYTFAEIKGENPRILKSGNTPVSVYKDLWHAISSGKAWEGEIQNRKKNGELYWEYGHFAPVIDEYGVIRHYLTTKEDITLRKQNEQTLLLSEHRFRSLFDNTEISIWDEDFSEICENFDQLEESLPALGSKAGAAFSFEPLSLAEPWSSMI